MLDAIILFFFSSRRRHTRYWRDWSSDVCSSDLDHRLQHLDQGERRPVHARERAGEGGDRSRELSLRDQPAGADRSEERRVGKECRSRWSPDHEKKNEKKIKVRGIGRRGVKR